MHGLKEENFTQAQFDTLNKLAIQIEHNYENISFHGHCEVSKKAVLFLTIEKCWI